MNTMEKRIMKIALSALFAQNPLVIDHLFRGIVILSASLVTKINFLRNVQLAQNQLRRVGLVIREVLIIKIVLHVPNAEVI